MAHIESSFLDIRTLDTLSYRGSFIHRLDPRIKLLTTLAYIVCVVSFDKYAISGLIPFILYPVVLVALADLPPAYLVKKILLAAPFALFIGIFNPLLDRAVVLHLGPVAVSGGWVSFASIMIRFFLTVSAALVLIAATGLNAICMAMEKMGCPRVFAVQLLLLYRYIFVLTDEALRMVRARALRSFGGKGLGLRVYASMTGQLLLRTLDRAQRIHLAMLCRGFDGEIRVARPLKIKPVDLAFFLGWLLFFALMRFYNLPRLMGDIAAGVL